MSANPFPTIPAVRSFDPAAPASPIARRRIPLTLASATMIVTLVAILARWIVFGNPLVHIDEQFYLLVGDRMLHGAIPYVDIWDRKPIGLFLLFAGTRMLGGGGIWQYQIVALIFVIATAMILFAMARRVAGAAAGLGAAVLYVLYLNLAGGEGGQAPVWYNPVVAGAIAIIFFARGEAVRPGADLRRPGMAAMLLFGIALQIKYSALFEGLFAGIALIGLSWRRGRRPAALIADMVLWIACALAPTAIVGIFYAAIGHFDDWLFANFTSILLRGAEAPASIRMHLAVMALLVVPLVFAVPLRRWVGATPASGRTRDDLRFLDAWAASAMLGVVLFGTWYNHYALPLFAPLAVTAAPLVTRRAGRIYFGLLLIAAAGWGQHMLYRHVENRGDAATLAAATAAMAGHRNCIFVYDGMPAIYYTTHSCLPTPHLFPAHLESLNERGATGIAEEDTVRAIMARRPDRVMTMEPAYPEENSVARAGLYRVLRSDYVERARYPNRARSYVIYALKGSGGAAISTSR
ncbi:MAG TPA: hypothetical protein VGC10_05215 [Sphingomonas sp.]